MLIHLHGGAFRSGRKSREARPLLYRLASQGWVCISANYRLSPAATFPDHLIDVKKVIAWAREHGPEYGADPAVVFVAGSSAGGHLASLAALTPNDPVFQPGFEGADTSVAAAISLYGYYGSLGSDHEPSSPLAYVRPDAPPFFVAHGDKDTLVLVEDARHFVERLQGASSNPVVYAELPGAQHTFDLFHSLRFETVVDAIEAFAAWVRNNGAQPRFAGEPRPGVTAAATTAVFATGEGPGVTAAATTAVFATGWPMTPTLPTRAGLSGILVSFGRKRFIGLDGGDDRLNRDPSVGDQLAARTPGCRRERRSPEVLPDEHAGSASRLHRSGEVHDVVRGQQLRELGLECLQLVRARRCRRAPSRRQCRPRSWSGSGRRSRGSFRRRPARAAPSPSRP